MLVFTKEKNIKQGETKRANTFLVFRKTILASHLRYKKGIILVADAVSENDFSLETKNHSMKDVFLVENCILDKGSMSLASAQETANANTSRFQLPSVKYVSC